MNAEHPDEPARRWPRARPVVSFADIGEHMEAHACCGTKVDHVDSDSIKREWPGAATAPI